MEEYLQLVQERAEELFGFDQPAGAERRVATIWSLSLERVQEEAPAAEALLQLCAFLAPDDIPRALPCEHAALLPEELGHLARDLLAYNNALGVLGRYSLATVTPTALGLHRLVQAVIRARLGEEERRWAQVAIALLHNAFPYESWELASWPTCERLLSHALAAAEHAERLQVASEQVGELLWRASIYIQRRGQPREARHPAERALAATEVALGPDAERVGERCDQVGRVLRDLGDYRDARQQFERALEIGQATLGPNHPNMAPYHGNLGTVLDRLGDLAGAHTHHERALEIGQATLGPNHPNVAIYRRNLDSVVQQVGEE